MKQDIERYLIAALEFEWGEDGGFFFDYRGAKFNEKAFTRAYALVLQIDFRGDEKISKRLVALIYSIPFFLICNEAPIIERGGSEMLCEKAIADFSYLVAQKIAGS